jgi:hypothetical protein
MHAASLYLKAHTHAVWQCWFALSMVSTQVAHLISGASPAERLHTQPMHMIRMLYTCQSYTSSTALLQGGCAVLAGVAVAAGGLPQEATAFWHDRRVSLRQLLVAADARRLMPMFQQVIQ